MTYRTFHFLEVAIGKDIYQKITPPGSMTVTGVCVRMVLSNVRKSGAVSKIVAIQTHQILCVV